MSRVFEKKNLCTVRTVVYVRVHTHQSEVGLLSRVFVVDLAGELRRQRRPGSGHRPGKLGELAEAALGVLLDGLLERRDVPEGEEEEHHHVALVLYRRHLEEQP